MKNGMKKSIIGQETEALEILLAGRRHMENLCIDWHFFYGYCGLVMTLVIIGLGNGVVAWEHKAITWTTGD